MPPPPPPQPKGGNTVRTGVTRGRQPHPITVPSEAKQPPRKNSGVVSRSPVRSGVFVTMAFVGESFFLPGQYTDGRNEIAVYQQHCGGEVLCVYKGSLLEGETFQFMSRKHRGFPFSLTFFVNGPQVDRLKCCCEYNQRPSAVKSRYGHFRLLSVEGASPCNRCVIAAHLDKKSVPPKEKMEEDCEENPGETAGWKSTRQSLVLLEKYRKDLCFGGKRRNGKTPENPPSTTPENLRRSKKLHYASVD
ncbi:glutamate-rich protein 3-like [Athene cunicularia]|uniref:glutamate-rich protein 3-like n=1 Tax=Athene cunicularia TaxID=194338 RepID=UPI000EF640BE|nr:glutamate-rich protein 3-like [Athene cunicularia]